MKKVQKNSLAGFSFVEVILALFILSTGIISLMPLFISNIRESMSSRDQIIASMLSQEGVELVQSFRDNNRINGTSDDVFDSGNFPSSDKDDCRVSYDNDEINCIVGDYRLNLSSASGYYTHSLDIATKFQRKVAIKYSDGDDNTNAESATVTAMVVWGDSFPGDIADCNAVSKCAYSKLILTRW